MHVGTFLNFSFRAKIPLMGNKLNCRCFFGAKTEMHQLRRESENLQDFHHESKVLLFGGGFSGVVSLWMENKMFVMSIAVHGKLGARAIEIF